MTVQIGSQADVPAPGDPIVSPWHQDTASKLVHRFTSTSDRDAKWPVASVPRGAVCVTTDTDTLWQKGATAWINVTGQWVTGTQLVSNVSGSAVAAYRKTGNLVHWSGMWTGAVVGSNPIATPPFAFVDHAINYCGSALYRSNGVEFRTGTCWMSSTTGLAFAVDATAAGGLLAPTVPFTWKSTDTGSWQITYEAAP